MQAVFCVLIEENPPGWISKSLNIHEAQVNWAVQEEMARTVDDVLSRRTRALLLDAGKAFVYPLLLPPSWPGC